MDYHVIIVIACVFLASLFSILFINKFFKNKTYEEAAAEKKALVEKLYPTKINKKVKKFSVKRDSKKDKKQRQMAKDAATENDLQDSDDVDEEESQSVESSPSHNVKIKPHVEFSQVQELTNEKEINDQKGNNKQQNKKKTTNKGGILINKTESSPIQENLPAETLNHFEKQHPKDVIEMKKQHKEEHIVQLNDGKNLKNQRDVGKKANKKKENIEQSTEQTVTVKEVKSVEVKSTIPTTTIVNHNIKTDSPKSQGNKKNTTSNKSKNNTKDLTLLDKIGQNDVIGVNCLMQLFAKAELNRNDIQILIDFLLNKQQDTTVVAHEWSDDMVTKLRKQLTEKEKLLQDEIEASAGIQAKLKELRTEINAERAQFNSNIKAYTEELQSKKNEIVLLTSDIQGLNEKMQLERQQFQVKLRNEKQISSQFQQLNEHNTILQNEIVQKNSYINELQRITNASHQTVEEHKQKLTEMNEIYQQKINQIHSLESGLAEANETTQRLQYDLEMAKISENEKEGNKVEIRNLQNALETTKSELNSANKQINECQQKILTLNNELDEMRNQYSLLNLKCQDSTSETTNIKNSLENYKKVVSEKDNKLIEFENKLKQLISKEDELMKQISEQREKNNDLRTKNWKLNEALQSAETNVKKLADSNNKTSISNLVMSPLQTATAATGGQAEKNVRDMFQRLFPDAVKKHSTTALSVSFDQWIEQITLTHVEQITDKMRKQQQQQNQHNNSSNENCNLNNSHHSPHNHNNVSSKSNNSSSEVINIRNLSSNSSNINNISNDNNSGELLSQNIKLKAQIEELTNIVTKTESVLKNLENQARDQDAHWRKIVQSKEEEIISLRNANGEAI